MNTWLKKHRVFHGTDRVHDTDMVPGIELSVRQLVVSCMMAGAVSGMLGVFFWIFHQVTAA